MVYTSLPEMDSELVEEVPSSPLSFAVFDRRHVVDLEIRNNNNNHHHDDRHHDNNEDSGDDVVVISGGRRREAKMTNDSGVGIVAEDLGAEEECYDDGNYGVMAIDVGNDGYR